jgi:hypothetical protein
MSIEGLIGTFILVALVAGYALFPLLRRSVALPPPQANEQDVYEAQYAQVLRNIRDLDEDHATDKIDLEQYQTTRAALVEQGVQLLKALDAHAPASTEQADRPSVYDQDIERMIAQARQKSQRTEGQS